MPVSCNEVPMNPEKVDHSEIKKDIGIAFLPLCPCCPEAQLSAAGHLACLCLGSMLGSAVWARLAAPAIFSLALQYFLSSSLLVDSAPFLQECLPDVACFEPTSGCRGVGRTSKHHRAFAKFPLDPVVS